MVDYKGMVRAVWRWFNPKEEVMQGTEQVIDELAADKAATEAAAEPVKAAPAPGGLAPADRAALNVDAIDTRAWDVRYREGVDRVQALNIQLHAVRGKVLGANDAVAEAEQSMALAQKSKAAATQDVADTRDETILTLKTQRDLIDERIVMLEGI